MANDDNDDRKYDTLERWLWWSSLATLAVAVSLFVYLVVG